MMAPLPLARGSSQSLQIDPVPPFGAVRVLTAHKAF